MFCWIFHLEINTVVWYVFWFFISMAKWRHQVRNQKQTWKEVFKRILINPYKKFTGWPTKVSPFFFGNNFYKNKETFKIFSPQILEVYRILLVETTLESIMFCYTFSVITTVFVPYIALLYDSTAATRTLKFPTALLSISCGIHLIFFLIMSSLVCRLFSRTLSFRYPLRK